jgi:hypothetical protein
LQAIALRYVNSEDLFVRKLLSQHVSGRDGYGHYCQDELTTGLLEMLKTRFLPILLVSAFRILLGRIKESSFKLWEQNVAI